MYIERPKELFKPCIIKPLEDLPGLIIAIRYDRCSSEVLVRYFMHGIAKYTWFFDFDIEVKESVEKSKKSFY